ncbi:hypothetical protein FPOAC1_004788 [Fusarium poae]|jgi:hypothetical protein|uniref:hypothetical protein n=1 Tax=Fusarium poae TaxID=36050 RepID=UPI001CEADC6A|nr:hypothetical protein FPOAC1_004788 [Fusarium poae]KAG8671538.1 hypothetical protein FPOAC1_004788 [Fusarium poae]
MKTAILLPALASSTAAFRGGYGVGGAFENMTTNQWQARFEDANATGTYYFDAYNVSESFPPNKTTSGWSATIRVANITDDPDPESIPYPGTDISIKAPDGMKLPESNSTGWQACATFWPPDLLTSGATSDAQHDDGDCSSFLSQECIGAIKASANGYIGNGGRCTNIASIPSSCEKWYGGLGTTGSGSIGNFSRRFNGSTLFSERPQLIGSSEHTKTEEEAYEEAVRGVWTVIINWGRRSSFSYSPGDVLQPTVLCLRTRNITEGSEDPNAGSRTVAYVPMALFVSTLATIMLAY